ncbi:MAG: ATP-binding protein [Gammaproteobacteria bacterium]|nr:ATP-binding protein [Gammaproteobacteria bacterium]
MSESNLLTQSYYYLLVFLSIVIAFVTAFTCFLMVHNFNPRNKIWHIIGGTVLALGIWATHYLVVAALILPNPINFELNTVYSSVVAVVFGSVASFLYALSTGAEISRTGYAGISLGTGVALSHYLLLEAMTIEVPVEYDPIWLAISFFTSAFAATFILSKSRSVVFDQFSLSGDQLLKASLAVTAGIVIVHFSGMGAVEIAAPIKSGTSENLAHTATTEMDDASNTIFGVVVMVLMIVIALLLLYALKAKNIATNEQEEEQEALENIAASVPTDNDSDTEDSDNTETPQLTQLNKMSSNLKRAQEGFFENGETDKFYESVVDNVIKATDAEFGTMVFVDKNGKIKRMVSQGSNQKSADLTGQILANNKILDLDNEFASRHTDIIDDPAFSKLRKMFPEMHDVMIQAVKNENGLRSFIILGKGKKKTGEFSQSDAALTTHYANDVLQSLYNMHLMSKLKENTKELQKEKQTRKKLDNDLVKAKQKISRIERENLASQLATGVANNISTPAKILDKNMKNLHAKFNSLLNTLETEQDGANAVDGKKVREMGADILKLVQESNTKSSAISSSLETLKNYTQNVEAPWEQADINLIFDESLEECSDEISSKIKIRKKYGKLSPIECLPTDMRQLVNNLLLNAAQSIERNGMIEISSGEEQKQIWIKIMDTGKGIRKEDIDKIFDPFYSTKLDSKGTGLGLSQAYDIVQRHRGTMDIESQVGIGTAVVIKLPILQREQALAS